MTTPQDLSPFERRQNTLLQLRNREVRQAFADVIDTTPNDSPRRILMQDLLIEDADSLGDLWVKSELWKEINQDNAPVMLPNYDDIPITVKDKPHVHLYFQEKKSTAILNRRNKVDALISFRLVDRTVTTVTRADLNELKREINLAFPSSFVLNKGRLKYSYRDKANGFEFILVLRTETEAKEVITKVLAVRDKLPDWDNLRTSTSEQNFDERKTINILLVNEKLPKLRPIADCYLVKAYVTFGRFRTETLLERVI